MSASAKPRYYHEYVLEVRANGRRLGWRISKKEYARLRPHAIGEWERVRWFPITRLQHFLTFDRMIDARVGGRLVPEYWARLTRS